MYYILTKEIIIEFFSSIGIDITVFTNFQLSLVFLLSNIFALLFWLAILSIAYKIICRLF